MKFRTIYGDHNKSVTEAGNPIQIEYELVIDEQGREELKPSGETDLQEYIQSHRDSVDFNLIIQRYQAGDIDALERIKGIYADVSGLPTSLSEIMNLNNRGKMEFDKLPVEIKQLYGNNYMEFLADPNKFNELIKKQDATRDAEIETKNEGVVDEQEQ